MHRIGVLIFFSVFLIENSSCADVHIQEQVRPNSEHVELPDPVFAQFRAPTFRFQSFMMPADGRVSSTFGWRRDPITRAKRFHSGIDLANLKESSVRAAGRGRVMRAGWASGCGMEVMIEHGGGISTRYCHMARTLVRRGERVAAGEAIGAMGSSGRTTGPHLHFELIKDGASIDPSPYLSVWSKGDDSEIDNEMIAMNRIR